MLIVENPIKVNQNMDENWGYPISGKLHILMYTEPYRAVCMISLHHCIYKAQGNQR